MPATDQILKPGTLVIRRSIHISAPPEQVWREFETFGRFAAWFGVMVEEHDVRTGARRRMGHTVIAYEPREGGWIEMEVEVDGVPRRFGGHITVFDPGRELTFEDRWLPEPEPWEAPLLLTLRLTPTITGTMVELLQHNFEQIGEDASETHRGHECGWTIRQLEALRRIVEQAA